MGTEKDYKLMFEMNSGIRNITILNFPKYKQ